MIPSLIDKQDSFEIVRDQIAAILATESVSQQALAITAAKDPDLWKLRVFVERSNAWEQWLSLDAQTDKSPIINVWFDTESTDPKASNTFERQKTDGVFNIDCLGVGISSDDSGGGHKPGDREASFEAQRAFRLVRNILMAAEYTYLGLRGLVWSRMPQSATSFQPALGNTPIQHVWGLRLSLNASFNEFAPQVAEETLEYIAIDVKRAEDGQIIVEADYDYT